MSGEVKLQIHECEPGVAIVVFVTPPKDESERYQYLQQALNKWSETHPHFQIQDVQTLRRKKKTFGLGVFFQRKKSSITLNVKVEPELMRRYGGEYIEAITADAAGLLSDRWLVHDVAMMVNRREVAIFLERKNLRATIVDLAQARGQLSEQQEIELQAWFAGREFGYFVAPLAEYKPLDE